MNTRHLISTSCALAALLASTSTASAQGPVVLPSTGLSLDAPFPVVVTTNSSGDVVARADASRPRLSASVIPKASGGDRAICEKTLTRLFEGTGGASWGSARLIVNGAWYDRAVYFKVGTSAVAVVCLSDAETYVHSVVSYAGDFHDVDFDQGRALMVAMTDMIFGPSETRALVHHLAASRVMIEEPGEVRLEVEAGPRVDVIARKGSRSPELIIEIERATRASCGEALGERAASWEVTPTSRGALAPPSWHAEVLVVATDGPSGLVACVEGEEGRFLVTLYYRGEFTSKDYRGEVSSVLGALSNSVRARSARARSSRRLLRPRVNLGQGELDFSASLGVKVRETPGVEWSYQDRVKGLQITGRSDASTNVLVTRANFPGFDCELMLEQLSRDGKFGELRDAPYLPPSWHPRALENVDAKGLKASMCLDLPDGEGTLFASVFAADPDLSRPEFTTTYGVLFANIAHAFGVSRGPRSWLAWDRLGL